MKLSLVSFLAFLSAPGADNKLFATAECMQPALQVNTNVAIELEKVGNVEVKANDQFPFSYNWNAFDNFDGDYIFFVDHKNGIIYSRVGSSTDNSVPVKVWDMDSDDIPAGLTLDWVYGSAPQVMKVKAMTQGPSEGEVIVVFTSSTLPSGWSESDAALPPPGVTDAYACREITKLGDLYRFGTVPDCADLGNGLTTFTGYDSFYTFDFDGSSLSNPRPFFVSESHVNPGHLGGGIITLDDGNILWATGDCSPYGTDGSYAPQLDYESCGKILKIDPRKAHEFTVSAKGVRNSQQMRAFPKPTPSTTSRRRKLGKNGKGSTQPKRDKKSKSCKSDTIISFMDIGGVTAEEVNAFPCEALDSGKILNFGWGRNLLDGKAREGTFYVNHGTAFVLGTEPSCNSDQPAGGEEGFVRPWVQFGRTPEDAFFGISSMAIPSSSSRFSSMPLIWSEFNTGKLLGTYGEFEEGAAPKEAFQLLLVFNGVVYTGINELVDLDIDSPTIGFTNRGDPRLFHFPDGEIGLLIERTGAIYKLTEIAAPVP